MPQEGIAAAADARRPTAETPAAAMQGVNSATEAAGHKAGSLRALSVAGCRQVGGAGLAELCRVCARTLVSLDASRTCISALPAVIGKVCPLLLFSFPLYSSLEI